MNQLRRFLLAFVLVAFALPAAALAQNVENPVYYVETAPTVDGEYSPDEYAGPTYEVNNVVTDCGGGDCNELDDGSGDNNSTFRLVWDEEALYVAFVVEDNVFVRSDDGASDAYWYDSVELLLDGNLSRGSASGNNCAFDGDDDFQLSVEDDSVGVGYCNDAGPFPYKVDMLTVAEMPRETKPNGATAVTEMKVPWDFIFRTEDAPEPGISSEFGLDVAVNDDDDGDEERDHKLDWASDTNKAFAQPARWDTVTMTDADGNLPVELAHFEAAATGAEAVSLSWRTLTEDRNDRFEVQRRAFSVDGSASAWTTIHEEPGHGTTSAPKNYSFTDRDLPFEAQKLVYRLRQVDTDGGDEFYKSNTVEVKPPEEATLLGNAPNPFDGRTNVRYRLPEKRDVTLEVFDVRGRKVRTLLNGATQGSGPHVVPFEATGLSSGTYLVRLQAGDAVKTSQMTLVR